MPVDKPLPGILCARPMPSLPPRTGATLIELALTLGVVALLATLILPRAGALLDRSRTSAATAEGVAVFGVARHLAIRRGRRTTVTIDTATATLLVRLGEDTAHHRPLGRTHGVVLHATRDSMSFHPTGIGYGAANLTLRIERGRAADTIVVSRLGRVRH